MTLRGSDWQPIATAPKDRTEILAFSPTAPGRRKIRTTWWRSPEENAGYVGWGEFNEHWPPTHWMPLPAPPGAPNPPPASSKAGWAVVDGGEIKVRTVSDTRRAAIVNWLVEKNCLILAVMSDEQIEKMWFQFRGGADVEYVTIFRTHGELSGKDKP